MVEPLTWQEGGLALEFCPQDEQRNKDGSSESPSIVLQSLTHHHPKAPVAQTSNNVLVSSVWELRNFTGRIVVHRLTMDPSGLTETTSTNDTASTDLHPIPEQRPVSIPLPPNDQEEPITNDTERDVPVTPETTSCTDEHQNDKEQEIHHQLTPVPESTNEQATPTTSPDDGGPPVPDLNDTQDSSNVHESTWQPSLHSDPSSSSIDKDTTTILDIPQRPSLGTLHHQISGLTEEEGDGTSSRQVSFVTTTPQGPMDQPPPPPPQTYTTSDDTGMTMGDTDDSSFSPHDAIVPNGTSRSSTDNDDDDDGVLLPEKPPRRPSAIERFGELRRSDGERLMGRKDESGGRSKSSAFRSSVTNSGAFLRKSAESIARNSFGSFGDSDRTMSGGHHQQATEGGGGGKQHKHTKFLPKIDLSKIQMFHKQDSESESEKNGGEKKQPKNRRWSLLLNVVNVERQVPKHVREKRARRGSLVADEVSARNMSTAPPTRLHQLCADSNVTIEILRDELLRSPHAASIKDFMGRYPLHVLGDNDALFSNPLGRASVLKFSRQLVKVNAAAITTIDQTGFMPFVSLVKDWDEFVYEKDSKKTKSSGTASNVANRLITGVANVVTDSLQPNSDVAEGGAPMTSSKQFPQAEIWEEVECCIDVLSMAMDELAGENGGLHNVTRGSLGSTEDKDMIARNELVSHIVNKMPRILKTVLLLEGGGGSIRNRILETSLFRRILLCPESVGRWLTNMLQKKGNPSVRGIDYLELVSGTHIKDYVGGFRPPIVNDWVAFHESKESVFDAIEALDGTAASLIVLENRQTERAATTPVLQHIMTDNLGRPFVVSLVLIDLVLHITLLQAFRDDVSIIFQDGSFGRGVPTQVVYFICFHYLIRKGCESVAMLSISIQVLKGYILDMWNLFDMIAIIMTLVAFIWNDANPGIYRNGLNSFVLGLLWIKVLSFLKVVNKQMSTFIMALIQILKDLIYFAIVLIVIVFMFADMLRIAITTKDNGSFCEDKRSETIDGELEGPIADFCSPDPAASYLRVYSVLIGDFELDDWRETSGMVILFVIFTVVGVIILLNVLIAIISDSYEKAKIESALLFGRARVAFVALNQALEIFLQPGSNPVEDLKVIRSPGKALVSCLRVLRWLILISLIATAFSAEVFLVAQAIASLRVFSSIFTVVMMGILSIVLTAALWVLIIFAFGNAIRACFCRCGTRIFDGIDKWTNYLVKLIGRLLFGLSFKKKATSFEEEDTGEEEWTGRLVYMEHAMKKTVGEAKEDLKSEIAAMERRMYEHEDMMRQLREKERIAREKEQQALPPPHSDSETTLKHDLD